MFAQNVSFGLDYSFIDIGSETIRFDGPAFDEIAVRVEPDNIQTSECPADLPLQRAT